MDNGKKSEVAYGKYDMLLVNIGYDSEKENKK